jgi:hypothetical protein
MLGLPGSQALREATSAEPKLPRNGVRKKHKRPYFKAEGVEVFVGPRKLSALVGNFFREYGD